MRLNQAPRIYQQGLDHVQNLHSGKALSLSVCKPLLENGGSHKNAGARAAPLERPTWLVWAAVQEAGVFSAPQVTSRCHQVCAPLDQAA